MSVKQLYLRKKDDGYEFLCQEFDEKRIPIKEEYMFKEAAIVIMYPDGIIEALPIVRGVKWHVEYYKKLITKSPRFASIIKHFPDGWSDEYNTLKVNKIMAKMGMIVIHNMDIPVLPEEYKDRENFYSAFMFYGANKLTKELEDNLNMIFDNYPNEYCLYSKKKNNFEDESVKRR